MPESTPTSNSLHQRRLDVTLRGIAVFNNFFAQRASNAELWDADGKRYIDFAGGIAVLNTGHRHPRIMEAVGTQMQRFTHTCYNVTPYEDYSTASLTWHPVYVRI
ncbi:aminotransferase class III-fold pyridoxal phosphate-dependent enzyme [Caballeronia sp. DA-9]|uniref:aminotransferase class III-fold pyridoxal phosphate-dependent enzyme n=1 Tax=Caballeronia sp. DA-9 TaxID=3436237 RepID=UPI003F680230